MLARRSGGEKEMFWIVRIRAEFLLIFGWCKVLVPRALGITLNCVDRKELERGAGAGAGTRLESEKKKKKQYLGTWCIVIFQS